MTTLLLLNILSPHDNFDGKYEFHFCQRIVNYLENTSNIGSNKSLLLNRDTVIEIEKDRESTEPISHCLKRVTFELADLQRRSTV